MKTTNKKFFSYALLRNGAAILAVAALVALASSSHAAIITISTGAGEVTLDSADHGEVTPVRGDVFNWSGSNNSPDQWDVEWNLNIDPDPFVAGSIGFTNLTNATQTVTMTVTEAVGFVIPAGASMSGTSILTLLDPAAPSPATMSAPAGSAIYTALIDGMDEQQLFADPTTLDTTGSNPEFQSQSFAGVTGQAVTASIGIRHHFELSAGDSATANSSFVVVPEPSAVALAFLGGFGLLLARRRNA